MTLEEFVKPRLGDGFKFKITKKNLELRFGTFDDGKSHFGITVADNSELRTFNTLLAGRVVKLIGNRVGRNTTVAAYRIMRLTI